MYTTASVVMPSVINGDIIMLHWAGADVLLLTMNQKQTQWHMAHLMASQFMRSLCGDVCHRSWNGFK